jgi:hypothetical protein
MTGLMNWLMKCGAGIVWLRSWRNSWRGWKMGGMPVGKLIREHLLILLHRLMMIMKLLYWSMIKWIINQIVLRNMLLILLKFNLILITHLKNIKMLIIINIIIKLDHQNLNFELVY